MPRIFGQNTFLIACRKFLGKKGPLRSALETRSVGHIPESVSPNRSWLCSHRPHGLSSALSLLPTRSLSFVILREGGIRKQSMRCRWADWHHGKSEQGRIQDWWFLRERPQNDRCSPPPPGYRRWPGRPCAASLPQTVLHTHSVPSECLTWPPCGSMQHPCICHLIRMILPSRIPQAWVPVVLRDGCVYLSSSPSHPPADLASGTVCRTTCQPFRFLH